MKIWVLVVIGIFVLASSGFLIFHDNSNIDTSNESGNEKDNLTEQQIEECIPDWQCGEWSSCPSSEIQTRTCFDLNYCKNDSTKPLESQECEYIPNNEDSQKENEDTSEEEIENQEEEETQNNFRPIIVEITSPNSDFILEDSVEIIATTNRSSTCEYKTQLNHPNIQSETGFTEMSSTGSSSHSQNIGNLKNSGTYTIILNCSDELGFGTDEIEFSVDLIGSLYFEMTGLGGLYREDKLPYLVPEGSFYDGDSLLIQFTDSIRTGGTIENSTSNGDLESKEILIEVGTNPASTYLYKYERMFSKGVDFTNMHTSSADYIEILGEYYKVQEGSTNERIILERYDSREEVIFENNEKIKLNGETINGTLAELSSGSEGVYMMKISIAMQESNKDYILVGESYTHPVFSNFKIVFDSYSEGNSELHLKGIPK